jgi:hypothetical protein
MTKQLTLIDTPKDWRLDERTREVGREGLAKARAALLAGRRTRSQDPPFHRPSGGARSRAHGRTAA